MSDFNDTHSRVPAGSKLYFFCLVAVSMLMAAPGWAQTSFITFESGQVRPIALTPDGSRLLAVNTPDNRLEVFSVTAGSLTHINSIPVGMEPVAIAARSNSEIWVVNHLSDSVSIVDISASPARVVRTLLVGDEPRDIVFGGTGFNRAFITTAHRGQHRVDASIAGVPGAGDPQLTTAGIGRADVWVFDAANLGATLGGTPAEILSFFADTPRGLAVTPDGSRVYVAAHFSGNQTTVINETVVPDGFGANGVPGPNDNAAGVEAPETGVIVKFDGSDWRDSSGTNWNGDVNLSLPDHDVFSINADTLAPASIVEYDHVGTILFNLVVNPVTGKVYVTNTELPNHVDFEGPGDHGGSTVQGHLSESRISVLDPVNQTVDPQHLNKHIDYSKLHTDVPDLVDITQKNHSLATPLQPVLSSDGTTLYVAAYGSSKIGVFNAADIESANFEATFNPATASANYISTSGGPSGLALDEANNRLYVLTRFGNQVEVVNLGTKATVETHTLHNPEPQKVVEGRPFLYDANATSGNGETSCSSCHIFGDLDHLAWNLGNPDDGTSINNQPSATPLLAPATTFHPMKGPMTTQTLRGMATHGALHWRGDRADGFFGTDSCTEPTGAPCSEDRAFRNFIVAFEGLVGMDGTITSGEMQQFADFALEIMMPPNPVRALNNALTVEQQSGEDLYFNVVSDTVATCDGCHTLNPAQGFFGSGGDQTFEGEPQNFKVAQLRNVYQKIGMFGQSTDSSSTGEQIRGFGLLHDGSVDTVGSFLHAGVFSLNNTEEAQSEAFALAFPTDLAPIVGQQVTLTATNAGVVNPRIDLLIQRSAAPFASLMLGGTVTECDLVVKGSFGGELRGWVRESSGQFRSDQNTLITDTLLRDLAVSEGPLTYTCAPPGSGSRMGINRDEDDYLDGLDNCPAQANTDQLNTDGDVEGNACDLDDDNDNLLDSAEILLTTDPLNPDSDSDGFLDGEEVLAGTDPLDQLSFPVPYPDGDINDDDLVDIKDALLAARILLGLYDPTAQEQSSWDLAPLVNDLPEPDQENNLGDYLILQKKVLGLVDF
jgi:DNA-binding beta-propeller fold protein YncE